MKVVFHLVFVGRVLATPAIKLKDWYSSSKVLTFGPVGFSLSCSLMLSL